MSRRFTTLAVATACVVARVAHAQPEPTDDDGELEVPAKPIETTPAPPPPDPQPPVPARPALAPPAESHATPPVAPASPITVRAYVQSQYQHDQQSQDELAPGGGQLNLDQFVVRRARVYLGQRWDHAGLAVEVDANTVRGAAVGLRRAEAALVFAGGQLVVGLSDIPFGHELLESSRDRLFAERTTASVALFPGEPDIGAQVTGAWRQFRYAAAVLAGEPVSERAGLNRPDPNAAKDLLLRGGVDAHPIEALRIAAGFSVLAGTGFHAGRSATKDSLEWRDANENGAVDLGEVIAVPGVSATPSANFRRWALGIDLQGELRTSIGTTRVAAEVVVASNLDRGLAVADPIVLGRDVRELGAMAQIVQDLGAAVFVGVRFDYYDPNLDAFDQRAGLTIPVDASITTLAPLLGVRLPWNARVTLQYDAIADHLARDKRGVPTDLANDRFTARLQVAL